MSNRNRLGFKLLAIGFGLGFFLLLDALIAFFFPVPPPMDRPHSFVGRGSIFETIDRQDNGVWRPSPSWFGGMRYYQEDIATGFRMPKPQRTMRIICLGGSSTAGYPFGPRAAFGRRLGLMLDRLDPATRHQVINLGVNGASSNQVRLVFEEVLSADPDLIIIYSGHNDCMFAQRPSRFEALAKTAQSADAFLQRFQIYRLIAALLSKEPTPTGDDPVNLFYPKLRKAGALPQRDQFFYPPADRQRIGPRLAGNLRSMVRLARQRQVPLIVCTVAGNLRDEPPEGSVHALQLSPESRKHWDSEFSLAEREYRSGNYRLALDHFSAAAAIDPDFAFLNYRLGQLLLLEGRKEEGARELIKAVDSADLPHRALSVVNEVIRQTGGEGVILADVEAAFRAASPDGAPGYDWFLDGMHPNLAGHQLIAEVLLRTMIRSGLAREGATDFATAVSGVDQTLQLSPDFLYDNYFYLATEQEYLGRIERALRLSRMALKAKPQDELTRVMMIERMEKKYGGLDTWE